MSRRLDANQVSELARGRWVSVLGRVAPALGDALAKPGRHTRCPVHGSTRDNNGFRLFADVNDTGGGVCNTCGKFGNGFKLIGWVNGWTFRQSLEAVADALGMTGDDFSAPPATPQEGRRASDTNRHETKEKPFARRIHDDLKKRAKIPGKEEFVI